MQDDLNSAKRHLVTFLEKNADLAKDVIATKAITSIAEEIYVEDLLNTGVPPENIPQDSRARAQMHRAARVKGVISRSVTDVLEDAKGRFLKWRGGDASPKTEPKSQERVAVDRTERRMALPNQPSRSARPAAAVEQPASGQTRTSAIIAGMRKSRGQLVA